MLADPQHEEHPARAALAALFARYLDHLAQLERLMSISDRYQSVMRERSETLEERYRKQLRHLQKIIRISDRYQEMLRDAFLALGESEGRFRSLVVASAQLVWSSDADGRVRCNAAPEGEPADRAAAPQSTGWFERIHPEDRHRVEEAWAQAVLECRPFHAECRIRMTGDAYRDYSARAVPVMQDEELVREWVGTLTDVSEQKLAEAARAEQMLMADRLEHFRMVATSLAHEINNPMAIIVGNVQLLGRSRNLSDIDRERLEAIGEAAHRVGELVIGLRDLQELIVTSESGIARLDLGGRDTSDDRSRE